MLSNLLLQTVECNKRPCSGVGAYSKRRLIKAEQYRMIFLRVLKVFEKSVGESNTETRVKYQPVFQKKVPNNMFIVKFRNLTPEVKVSELKCNRKN